jgi:predicted enzyme related to lactoylglutathione lyase
MNQLLKIDSIMFYTSDLEKATQFYQEAMGLKKVWTDPEKEMVGFIFPKSDTEIVIHCDSSLPNPSFSFQVENVEDFCKEHIKRGYAIRKEPFKVRCGKYAILADPDDNEIHIIDLTKFGNVPKYDTEP